jgi:hypothetical protein
VAAPRPFVNRALTLRSAQAPRGDPEKTTPRNHWIASSPEAKPKSTIFSFAYVHTSGFAFAKPWKAPFLG